MMHYTLNSIDYPGENINIISVCKIMEWNSWKWIWTMEYDANHRYIHLYNVKMTPKRCKNDPTNVSSLISEDRYIAIVTQLNRY